MNRTVRYGLLGVAAFYIAYIAYLAATVPGVGLLLVVFAAGLFVLAEFE